MMDDLSGHVSSVFPDPRVSNLALNSASPRASDGQSGPEKMEAELRPLLLLSEHVSS